MGKKIYIGSDQIGSSGGSGIDIQTLDASLKAYTYNKLQIDASFVGLDSSMNYIYDYAADVSARVGSGDGGGSAPDLTNYATKDDISTFKPIQYVNLSTYEENVSDGTIDQDTMYVITDLADSEELATLVTVDDLSTYKATILSDVSTTADQTIANASTSINSIKTTAISAVQSQQTTSVNAVNTARNNANTSINTAKTNAISDISNYIDGRVAEMKNFVVISDASYNDLQTIDPNTIYFITD
jgi:hypothetical protein